MTIYHKLTLLFFLVPFVSCKDKLQETVLEKFDVSLRSMTGDSIITSAVYFNDHILFLQESGKLTVLDTSLNCVDSLNDSFSNLKVWELSTCNDTIFVGVKKAYYFLDTNFTLKRYLGRPAQSLYFKDSTYEVNGCSAGEWGGAVFFTSRETNKTYSYPATAVKQVLKFNETYIVCSMLGFSDFLSIKDPTKLYEINFDPNNFICNWYMDDSIKDKLLDTKPPTGLEHYGDTLPTRALTTFQYNKNLYTIYCIDSFTILAKHVDFNLIPQDTLLKRKIDFTRSSTHTLGNLSITSYSSYWGTFDKYDREIRYQNTGLIFIIDNRITFVEFEIPHMWKAINSS